MGIATRINIKTLSTFSQRPDPLKLGQEFSGRELHSAEHFLVTIILIDYSSFFK